VTRPVDAVLAPPDQRPSYLARDLSGLLIPHPPVTPDDGGFRCRGWRARWQPPGRLALDGDGDPMDALRALCAAAWSADRPGPGAVAETLKRVGW
jgi:glycerol-1-phosphatase